MTKGHKVYAVDSQEESIKRTSLLCEEKYKKNLVLVKSKFEKLDWDRLPKFDVIITISSISFLKPQDFYTVWEHIYHQLKENGVIIARFFSNQLTWPRKNNMTLPTKDEIDVLIKKFEVINNHEEIHYEDNHTIHFFNLILRMKNRMK